MNPGRGIAPRMTYRVPTSNNDDGFLHGLFAIVGLLLFGALFVLRNCTDADDDQILRAIEAQGYSSPVISGYAVFGCSKEDSVSRYFSAVNAKGDRVEGVVCCGLVFKDCTIRWR